MSLADLPGVPQSRLPDALLAGLPQATPAPPWRCRVEAVIWWHRAAPAARPLLPAALPPGPGVTVGAFVRYLDTPVGPYDEILASPHLVAGAARRGVLARVHVPFIAVDSLASVHGGRAHWGLPKALAAFTRSPGTVRADGDGWWVSATARPRGPWLPALGRLGASQVDRGSVVTSSVTTSRSLARLATVEVDADNGLAPWLLPGRHRGVVLRGRMIVGPATLG